MKRVVTLSIGMLALAGTTMSTQAADLGARPIPNAPILAPTPVANWSGFYLGVGLGARWNDSDWQTTCLAPLLVGTAGCPNDVFFPAFTRFGTANPTNFSQAGVRGSVYGGYNWQFANWVAGIEGDAGWSDNSQTVAGIPGTFNAVLGPGADTATLRDRWDASARLRLGYLVTPTALLYATGGVAFLDTQISASCAGTFPVGWCGIAQAGSVSTTFTGWTAGGGVEWMFAPNWIVRGEYRFSDYGTKSFQFLGAIPADSFNFTVKEQTHTAYVGLHYLFNWAAPVVSRY